MISKCSVGVVTLTDNRDAEPLMSHRCWGGVDPDRRGRPVSDPLVQDSSIRTTLLHRPPAPGGALVREDLLALLDAGLRCPATLIAAPAGYGKSVLVSQWCQRTDHATVWMSLAGPVDSLRDYLRYMAVGVRAILPEALSATARLVRDGAELPEELAITTLANDLVVVPERLVIVLDDYHVIESAAVHRLMSELLHHPAASVHFMILSRRDPPLPLGALRVGGLLNELRMDDLRFTADQSAQLVGAELGRSLDADERRALDVSTEGWAAGLRLAVQAMRQGTSGGAVFGAAYLDRGAQEYLVAEVLDQQSPDVLRYLVAASYFDRFSAELCDAAVGIDTGSASMTGTQFIDWLQRENLFVIPLDNAGQWFRFHHVFGRLLAGWRSAQGERFGLDELELHRAAARVLHEHGVVDEALRELARADDTDMLVELATTHGKRLVDADRWGDLAVLLAAVPADLFEQQPALLVLRAWLVGEHGGRYRELVDLLDRAEALLDDPVGTSPVVDDVRGQIAVLRGTYVRLNMGDFVGALEDADTAQRLLGDPPGRNLVYAYALSAMALANAGRYPEARRVLDSAIGSERFARWPMDPMIWVRPMLAWVEGAVRPLELGGQRLLAAGQRLENRSLIAYGHYFVGVSAYERNELTIADECLSEAIDIDFTIIELLLHSTIALALTQHAAGRPAEAVQTGESMVQAMLDTRGDYNVPTAEAAMALLEFRSGRQPAALRWARAAESDPPRHRYMFFDRTPAMIEILLSSDADAARGRELLDRALRSPYGRFNRPVNVKLLGLAAIDASRTGDIDRALTMLRRGVDQASDGGLVRSLADLGPDLVPILQRLDISGAGLDHVGAVLQAIDTGRVDAGRRTDGGSTGSATGTVAGQPGLTKREVDILTLLAERYTNKEISRELFIAPATVKKHTVTLYEKLHVHGRREAVDKARALGYLTD